MRSKAFIITLLLAIGVLADRSLGQENRNFPIPKFMYEEQNVTSAALSIVMEEMAEHLCRKQDPVSADWEAKYNELLTELIVAEHAVIWAAAADFAPDERIALGDYYKEKDALLRLFDRLIPDNELLRLPANKLRTGGDPFTNTAAGAKFGRGVFTVFALRTLLHDVHKDSWQTMASLSEGPEYNRLMKRAVNVLGGVVYRMYARGIQIVDQKTAGAEFPFALYHTPDNLKDPVEVATIQKFLSYAGIRGASADRIAKFDNEIPWHTLRTLSPVRFEGSVQTEFRGRCFQPRVTVVFHPSRKKDADAAAEMLRRNNFAVELTEFRQDAVPNHKQKVYYQNRGSRRGAESISATLKMIETLNEFQGTDSQTSGSSDYSVWIVKKPETKPNLIRVNYTTERRADGERAIERLRAEGYLVIFEVVGYDESRSGQLLYRTGRRGTNAEANAIANIVRSIEPLTPAMNSGATEKKWPPYDLWIVTNKDAAALDLTGKWQGYNYNCPNDPAVQEIRITQTGNDVSAIKVSGNKCVGDGEVTFRGRFNGRALIGEMNFQVDSGRQFRSVNFAVRNKDLIVIDGRIEIRRKVD